MERINQTASTSCHFLVHSLVLILCAGGLQGCAIFNGNFKAVEADQLYRSGQLNARQLERQILRHGIKTIISLRKPAPDEKWFYNETRICDEYNVARFDLPWSHSTIPKPESVALLVKLLEEQSKPILVHCQGGVHRTGIASAIYQLNNEVPKEVASKEVGLFFMKAPIGDFLDLYPTEDSDFGNWVIVSYPSIYEDYNEEN